ncbi:hypothetical protein TNCV_3844211 [Trichonephila clavipes]|nr:hypothetical protein TNCV_3844211 [Trichonephila clavipes]
MRTFCYCTPRDSYIMTVEKDDSLRRLGFGCHKKSPLAIYRRTGANDSRLSFSLAPGDPGERSGTFQSP